MREGVGEIVRRMLLTFLATPSVNDSPVVTEKDVLFTTTVCRHPRVHQTANIKDRECAGSFLMCIFHQPTLVASSKGEDDVSFESPAHISPVD